MSRYRVWWVPQVAMPPFVVSVPDLATGLSLCDVLADYDLFQYEHKIKPDYCNTGGVQVYENGEWVDADDDLRQEPILFSADVSPAPPAALPE